MASEAATLLSHPNPAERQLALKLDSVEPEDVARAVLDPHVGVWQAAFHHPNSALALMTLASSSRDAAGFPLHDRHDLLLRDRRCTPEHVQAMHRAVENDGWLPIPIQAHRLQLTGAKLQKKESDRDRAQVFMADKPDPRETIVKVSQEESRYPDLLKAYNGAVNSSVPIRPEHAELAAPGQASPKVVYKAPPEHGNHRFLVKPYLEEGAHHAGWWEQTSHSLFDAAEIGHLHQKSFVASYNNLGGHIPAVVIKLEKATPIHKWLKEKLLYKNPKAAEEARKIAVMDFLGGNTDRHLNNLMVRDDGSLLAIDHGRSGSGYGDPGDTDFTPSASNRTHLARFTTSAIGHIADSLDNSTRIGGADYHALLKNWWPRVSADVKRAFHQRLQLLPEGVTSDRIRRSFEARHQWLDKASGVDYQQFLGELAKSVPEPLLKFLHEDRTGVIQGKPDSASKYDSVHEDLLKAHPQSVKLKAAHFERYVNHPQNPVPHERAVFGAENKALVKHADKTYLIKSASTPFNHLSGWAEMTSQAMYHAGGLGHLHQEVHATNLNIKDGGKIRQQQAVAVHFKPGKWTEVGNLIGSTRKGIRFDNEEDLRKAYVMDFLTANVDRHSENMMVKLTDRNFRYGDRHLPGPVQMIDHGLCFSQDATEDSWPTDFKNYNLLGQMGFYANDNTFNWWNQNKQGIVDTFLKHVRMIPNKEERAKRENSFMQRVEAVDAKHPVLTGLEDVQKAEDLFKVVLPPVRPINPQYEQNDEEPVYDEDAPRQLTNVVPRLDRAQAKTNKALAKMHPAHMQDSIGHFESTVNHPDHEIDGIHAGEGVETKTFIKHQGKTYLIKGMNAEVDLGEDSPSTIPLGGWKEMTNQAMYHAAGIGHLHQDVHISHVNYKTGPVEDPVKQYATVIHLKPGNWLMGSDLKKDQLGEALPTYADDLRKIYFMDTLTSNSDRHGGNLLFHEQTFQPQAIDHGFLFNSEANPRFLKWNGRHDPKFRDWGPTDETHQWWVENKQKIVEAFEKHAQLLPKSAKNIISERFYRGVDNADREAESAGYVGAGHFEKSLGNADFIHDQHADFAATAGAVRKLDTSDLHAKLMKAHPAIVNPGVRHFEITLNDNPAQVNPLHTGLTGRGIQPKKIYQSGSKKYLVKPAKEEATSLGAWNELTSQALYHAGGIGHLHQKVHATVAKTGLDRTEPAHAVAIHMEPLSMTYNDAVGWTDPRTKTTHSALDPRRGEVAEKEHAHSFRQMGLMDYLTGNHDRHGHNIVLKADGSPVAVDHARAFYQDRKHAIGEETEGELSYANGAGEIVEEEPIFTADHRFQHGMFAAHNPWSKTDWSGAANLGGPPDKDTWEWWNKAKGPMLDKFKEHVNMLPESIRQKMVNSYMERHNLLDRLAENAKWAAPQEDFSGQGGLGAIPSALGNAKTDISVPMALPSPTIRR